MVQTPYQKTNIVDENGELVDFGSGAGDASATNQATQIEIEEEIRDRIGNTPITGATMPTGGVGLFGWLSAIWKLISDRLPNLGANTAANSTPVTLANDGIFAIFAGLAGDAASATGSIHAKLRLIATSLITGIKTSANSLSFTPASDAIFTTQGSGFVSSTTIQRAANTTPYTANDVYGAAFEFQNIAGVAGQNILITSLDGMVNVSALPSGMGTFTLYLYSGAPPSNFPDNAAFSLPSGDRASILTPTGIFLGSAALATGGGTIVFAVDNLNLQFKVTTTSLFGYLVTNSAFTPAANLETATIRTRVLAV